MEDFIDESSNTAMSSVPVQFLVYVAPEPYCGIKPIILPLQGCLEVSVGVQMSFNVTVKNQCDWNYTSIDDLVISKTVLGMQANTLTDSANDPSVAYMTITWVPQLSQLGAQKACFIAYTE